ncbi:MAG: hypothetical protein ACRDKU_06150 [Gaiellaceae bacterium]
MRASHAASLFVALAAAAAVGFAVQPGETGDLSYFVHSAQGLLSGAWGDTYANPTLQIGPLQLVLFGSVDALAGAIGVSTTRLIGAVVGAAAAGLFWLVIRRLLGGRGGLWALGAAGLAPVALGLTFDAYRDGHPAQVLVPLLWVLAGLEIRKGRAWLAGGLVGLSAGLELWGVLGIVVFFAAPRLHVGLRALADAALIVLVLFAPFAFAGEFRMFEYGWEVNGDTLLSLLVEPGTAFTWQLRVLQGATALLAGAFVTWSLRRSTSALWAGPLAVVSVRLALDPVRYPWYWLALETLVLVGAVQLASNLGRLTISLRSGRAVEGSSTLT